MADPAPPRFVERAPWFGADLQTIRNTLRPRPPELPGGERLLLPIPDGDRLAARLDVPAWIDARPLVVLVHGLTGTEASVNVVATARHLVSQGWRVLRLNLRGTLFSQATSKGRYHAGRTEDLAEALRQLSPPLLEHGVVLVGHSLGGNLILKYMGERRDEGEHGAPVRGAVAVSTPLDLAATSRRIMAPRNILYHHYLLSELKREALAPGAALTAVQRSAIAASRSIYEFDDVFVAPMFGFRGADDYYAQSAACFFIDRIALPTLVLHAMDDPWIPARCYEAIDWKGVTSVETVFSPRGGHLGFHDRSSRIGWHDRVMTAWLDKRFVR